MMLILECDSMFQKKPGIYRSRLMTRVWWLWFAIGYSKLSLHEYSRTEKVWEKP